MKTIALLCLLSLLSSCATVDPLKQANVETNVIYRFVNPTLSTSLYLKLLPTSSAVGGLLFKTIRNNEKLSSLEFGGDGVYHQQAFLVSERGKLSFHFVDEGLFEELIRVHQYASSGSQQEELAIFRYRLDFRTAARIK